MLAKIDLSPLHLPLLTQHWGYPKCVCGDTHLWDVPQARSRASGTEVVILGFLSPCIFHTATFSLPQPPQTKVGNIVRMPPCRIPGGKWSQSLLCSQHPYPELHLGASLALCRWQPWGEYQGTSSVTVWVSSPFISSLLGSDLERVRKWHRTQCALLSCLKTLSWCLKTLSWCLKEVFGI